jgi:hypothetical protein
VVVTAIKGKELKLDLFSENPGDSPFDQRITASACSQDFDLTLMGAADFHYISTGGYASTYYSPPAP